MTNSFQAISYQPDSEVICSREEKVGDKTVLGSPKSPMAFHLIDERTFLYGRVGEVKKLLERPAAPTRKASWSAVLRSAPQHALQISVQRDLFPEDPKKTTPPPLKALNPLLDAHTAVARVDAGKELRLSLQLMFNGDEETKQAEQAARRGLDMAAAFLAQFAESFKQQTPGALPPPLNKLVPGVKDAEAAVKKATIQSKDHVLTCDLVLESSDWPEALAACAAMLSATETKSAPPRKPNAP